MKNVMIDLETLGTTPGSVILSIAAVYFDPETGATGGGMFRAISLNDSMLHGLRVESQTLQWWLEQRPEILAKNLENGVDLGAALTELRLFLGPDASDVSVWGNSARFDMGLLEAAYRAVGKPLPWNFRNEKDHRTIVTLWPVVVPDNEGAHDPVMDCKYQIQKLHKSLQRANSNDSREKELLAGVQSLHAYLRNDETSQDIVSKIDVILNNYFGYGQTTQ